MKHLNTGQTQKLNHYTQLLRVLLIHISLLIVTCSFGQRQESSKSAVSIMTTPLGVFDVLNGPNVNIGCEFGLKGKVYNYSSIGYYFSGFGNFLSDSWGNLQGGYFLNEIRYYFSSGQNVNFRTDYYWGIEAIYGNQSYVRSDTVLTSQSKNLKTYANKRQFIGLSGNIGVRWILAKRIMISLNFGIGLRYNEVKNNLTLEESESRELGDWNAPANWIQRKGNHLIPKFNLGFKVGFRIN